MCRRVRFEADVANDEAYLCHCRMCQQATGSVSIAFVSKLNSLCRLTNGREIAALIAVDRIEHGEAVEYEVIPI